MFQTVATDDFLFAVKYSALIALHGLYSLVESNQNESNLFVPW